MTEPIVTMAISAAIVASVELQARLLNLWRYRRWWMSVVNVTCTGGLVGLIGALLAAEPPWVRFAAGAAFGLAYEAINLTALRWWSFPDQRMLFIRGDRACATVAGLGWGVMPAAAPAIAAAVL